MSKQTTNRKIGASEPVSKLTLDEALKISTAHKLAGIFYTYRGAALAAANDELHELRPSKNNQIKRLVNYLRARNKKTTAQITRMCKYRGKSGYLNQEVESKGHKTTVHKSSSNTK